MALNLIGAADAGDDTVAELRAMAHLERLDLRGTSVSDASVDHLASLVTLRHLDIRGTRITPEGAARLVRTLPDCEIVAGPLPVEEPVSGR